MSEEKLLKAGTETETEAGFEVEIEGGEGRDGEDSESCTLST